jgi:hypothetical protein
MKRLMAALFCFLIPVGVALADGPGPQRKMTDKEASVFRSVRGTIQEALPKAPEGYDFTLRYQSDYDEGMIPEGIKPGEMFQVAYLASYVRNESLSEEETTSYFLDRAKGTPEQQARMAELNAKDAELSTARKNAKDPAEKDRIRAERKAVSAETDKLLEEIVAGYQAWLTSGGTSPAAQEIKTALPAKEITVWVRINQDVSLSDKAVSCAIDGGFPGLEQTDECRSVGSYCITVLVGPFEKVKKISGYTFYQLPKAGLDVPTKVLGMALTFTGPKDKPEIVRDFVRGTDLASLRSLLP